MKATRHIFFALSCLCFTWVSGQDYGNVQFIENKGQWDKEVLYMAEVPAGAIYIQKDGVTIVQHDTKDWAQIYESVHGHQVGGGPARVLPKIKLKSHAYKVNFLNAAANPKIVADKAIFTYNNYFLGNDPSKWVAGCRMYLGITIKDIYPNVDVRYYSQNGQVKYDLIANPGADVSRIALQYEGVNNLEVKGKELHIPTSVGTLKEMQPYTYQYTNEGKREVGNRYVVKNNTVTFDVKKYDQKSTLVIDPTLIFCSFSGSTVENWGFTATYGADGSMYGGGIVFGSGFPTSPGAFDATFDGTDKGFDIGIIKLTPDGSDRVYATYIGGKGDEQPHSLVVDNEGNLVIAGRTNSDDYPTRGINKVGDGGKYDIVVTKLNTSGTALIGSLKIGGNEDDGVNISTTRKASSLQQNYGDDGRSEVILDPAGNIFVASSMQSKLFPMTGPQTTFGGGMQDGVVLKLLPDVSNVYYSTYLGGGGNDAAYVLSINPLNGELYVGGGTESGDLQQRGGINGSIQGGIDGYVARYGTGGALIRTTYVGTSGTDQVFGVQFDKFGFPYIMGQTTTAWQRFNSPFNQPGAQFIAKLQPDLSAFVYSTTFGSGSSNPNISPVAFLVDRCENVYVSGWGGSINPPGNPFNSAGTVGLSVTANAIKSGTDGKDFYFFVLKKNAASQLYGSFFGQDGAATDHVDGGTSRFDRNGIIYQAICANCKQFGEAEFPTTPGAWQETNRTSKGCNLAMVKIEMDFAGVRAAPQSAINGIARDTAGCVPLTVDFTDTIQNAISYEWDFGDGSPRVTATYPNVDVAHVYNAVGIYRVMQIAIDSTTCNIRDTAYLNIRVGANKALPEFSATKISTCSENVFRYRFDNLTVPVAGQPFTATSFEWDFGDKSPKVKAGREPVSHTYTTAGTYNVKLTLVDENFCNAPDDTTIQLRIATNVQAKFETPPAACAPFTAKFKNVSLAGQQFYWTFGDGTTSRQISPEHLYAIPGTYIVTLKAVDSSTCNVVDSTSVTLIVSDKPTANFSAAPQPPEVNVPVVFTNQSSPDAVRFKWIFGDGDSLVTTASTPVSHEYNATGTFNACLIAYNRYDCTDTICKPIQTLIDAAVDVPNAFTPLSSDANNIIYVRGFGIAKMRFNIWNRWGQKVFETNTKLVGWDGKYKGVLQPMDVYAYTLEVEFSDGKKLSKKGDITLIR
ncbi:MAG TPA: PKD domain-containing protein [Chitinophagaceae bacterium]|nr:PKD domain-containing protein [Chitinophagaceae bacterium]